MWINRNTLIQAIDYILQEVIKARGEMRTGYIDEADYTLNELIITLKGDCSNEGN